MGSIINLRAAKKQIKRDKKEKVADQNRTKFGRTKAEKSISKTEKNKAIQTLDGKKLDNDVTNKTINPTYLDDEH